MAQKTQAVDRSRTAPRRISKRMARLLMFGVLFLAATAILMTVLPDSAPTVQSEQQTGVDTVPTGDIPEVIENPPAQESVHETLGLPKWKEVLNRGFTNVVPQGNGLVYTLRGTNPGAYQVWRSVDWGTTWENLGEGTASGPYTDSQDTTVEFQYFTVELTSISGEEIAVQVPKGTYAGNQFNNASDTPIARDPLDPNLQVKLLGEELVLTGDGLQIRIPTPNLCEVKGITSPTAGEEIPECFMDSYGDTIGIMQHGDELLLFFSSWSKLFRVTIPINN